MCKMNTCSSAPHSPAAVEELVALGADVNVTLGQQRSARSTIRCEWRPCSSAPYSPDACMCMPAVEELIALGADVNITISQERIEKWNAEMAPCKLSQRGGESFWQFKMNNLCLLVTAPEAGRGSILELIHLAVGHCAPQGVHIGVLILVGQNPALYSAHDLVPSSMQKPVGQVSAVGTAHEPISSCLLHSKNFVFVAASWNTGGLMSYTHAGAWRVPQYSALSGGQGACRRQCASCQYRPHPAHVCSNLPHRRQPGKQITLMLHRMS